ncbi:MAG: SDR family NAD(P)-dependent oxidoreductase [Sandaracinaceae bacterium]
MSSARLRPMGEAEPDSPITVLTGATGGIGGVVARRLLEAGHRLILPVRSADRGERLCATLMEEVPGAWVRWVPCDLASMASVRECAEEIDDCVPKLDRLVNNAAVYGAPRGQTVDGHETHLAVNYLAPFLLTHLLLPALERAESARVINVSGETARLARIDMKDLNRARRYTVLGAYGQAKLALILFTRALASRLRGTDVSVHAVHPGPAATGHLEAAPRWLRWLWSLLPGPRGAARSVWRLVLLPQLAASGSYYLGRLRGPAPCAAYRAGLVDALYARSSELVGVPALPEPGDA